MERNEVIQQLGTYTYLAVLEGKKTQEYPVELIKEAIKLLGKETDNGGNG